jgi:hypothetical protein
MVNTPARTRPTHDPKFQFVLVDSRFVPGTKAWKLVQVERPPVPANIPDVKNSEPEK